MSNELPSVLDHPKKRLYFSLVLFFGYVTILVLPAWIFFSKRGGIGFLDGADFTTSSTLLFPLVGLYAFTFVWSQLMIGANLWFLRRLIPSLTHFHRSQGIAVLFFALLHPLLLLVGVGFNDYLKMEFVDPTLKLFVWLGEIQLLLILITVCSALLRRRTWMRRWWRRIHLANYMVFFSAWLHSWYLGSDIQSTDLRWLWIFFGSTATLSILVKLWMRRPRPQSPLVNSSFSLNDSPKQ
jgi:hypothetical protein